MSKNNDGFFREKKSWSIIKDQLLGCYLRPYFSKILATKKPIYYVDAFAGKGMFDDGNPGSPIIALEIISQVLVTSNIGQHDIKSCFIELFHSDDLQENIKKYSNVTVIKGKYEDDIEQQLQGKQSHNVFLYIDPYGVKSLYFYIFERLSMKNFNSIEMLINFNSFGFIREACRAMNVRFEIEDLDELIEINDIQNDSYNNSIDDLNKVAGGDYWKAIIKGLQKGYYDGYEAEKLFADRYCEKLKKYFKYVLNMPIRLKIGQRPKYRMIYTTNHAQGCMLMNDNMCKRWEALQELQNLGQGNLFTEDVENILVNKEEVQKEILEIIQLYREQYVDIDKLLADFISKYGVRLPTYDICMELDKLCYAKKIEVKRNPEFTKAGKPSKFWTTSKGNTVKIRCL